jgi:hypothetical protein
MEDWMVGNAIEKFIDKLNDVQIWVVLGTIEIIFISLLYFLIKIIWERGLPYPLKENSWLIKPKIIRDKNILLNETKHQIWKKDIKNEKNKIIGTIGFIKDVVVFKLFGKYWNSADPDSKELLDIFLSEFHPPEYLDNSKQRELECFLFLSECNLQTKLISILRKSAGNWKHIYILASKLQIQGQELDMLLSENGGPDNISIYSINRQNVS